MSRAYVDPDLLASLEFPEIFWTHRVNVYRPDAAIVDVDTGANKKGHTKVNTADSPYPCSIQPASAGLIIPIDQQFMQASHVIYSPAKLGVKNDWIIEDVESGARFLVQSVVNVGEIDMLWQITAIEQVQGDASTR